LLAAGGGALGLVVAVMAGAFAAFGTGPARGAALFLATQGVALGPILATRALTGYFSATMCVGPWLLAAVVVFPVAVHLALAWLLTGLLAWSVAGAGVARLVAALAAVVPVLALARAHFAGTRFGSRAGRGYPVRPRRCDRALLWMMFREGTVLGVQQVVASVMVLLLYLRAAGAGDVTSAALTLTHAGVYPLLFAFAWGSSQAVGAAAAQAVGRGDARELARITWLGLGLSAVLAFALPWGVYALCGRAALAWLVEGGDSGGAVLEASARFMSLLAVFFVFDFAINFLSALLRAAKEQTYLLEVTALAAAGFGLSLMALPQDATWLLGGFLAAQAAWALLLLVRVVRHWPGMAFQPAPAAPAASVRTDRSDSRSFLTTEQSPMDPSQPISARLPAALRALVLTLLVETAGPLPGNARTRSPLSLGQGEGGADDKTELWQDLRTKCGELSALVLRADDPREAAAYVLGYFPKHLDYVFELIHGQKRPSVLRDLEALSQPASG
jgi:Na+-driven multidrug efflux pump